MRQKTRESRQQIGQAAEESCTRQNERCGHRGFGDFFVFFVVVVVFLHFGGLNLWIFINTPQKQLTAEAENALVVTGPNMTIQSDLVKSCSLSLKVPVTQAPNQIF